MIDKEVRGFGTGLNVATWEVAVGTGILEVEAFRGEGAAVRAEPTAADGACRNATGFVCLILVGSTRVYM